MPPLVTALDHVHIASSALENQDVLDTWCALECSIDDRLGGDGLATTTALIGGDNHTGRAVNNTVAKGLGTESSKDNTVDGADTSASKEGRGGVPCHGQVDTDGLALGNAEILENVGDPAGLAEKLGIGDGRTLTGLIGFVYDGGLRG